MSRTFFLAIDEQLAAESTDATLTEFETMKTCCEGQHESGFLCTRPMDHEMPHVAVALQGRLTCAIWND